MVKTDKTDMQVPIPSTGVWPDYPLDITKVHSYSWVRDTRY